VSLRLGHRLTSQDPSLIVPAPGFPGLNDRLMVSLTAQTEKRRTLRSKAAGRKRARKRVKFGTTPKFPVHPEGYDPNAADAKASSESK